MRAFVIMLVKKSKGLFTSADEKSVSEPRLEESVFISLVNVHMTAQDKLHVTRVIQEHQESGPNPDLHNTFLVERCALCH